MYAEVVGFTKAVSEVFEIVSGNQVHDAEVVAVTMDLHLFISRPFA